MGPKGFGNQSLEQARDGRAPSGLSFRHSQISFARVWGSFRRAGSGQVLGSAVALTRAFISLVTILFLFQHRSHPPRPGPIPVSVQGAFLGKSPPGQTCSLGAALDALKTLKEDLLHPLTLLVMFPPSPGPSAS